MLREQTAITVEGIDALVARASGISAESDPLQRAKIVATLCKRSIVRR